MLFYACQQEDTDFLVEVAQVFFQQGHPGLALAVCQMASSSHLHAVQLEVMGQMRQLDAMEELVEQVLMSEEMYSLLKWIHVFHHFLSNNAIPHTSTRSFLTGSGHTWTNMLNKYVQWS